MNVTRDFGHGFVGLDTNFTSMETRDMATHLTQVLRKHRGVQFPCGHLFFNEEESILVTVILGKASFARALHIMEYKDISRNIFMVTMDPRATLKDIEATMQTLVNAIVELKASCAKQPLPA